MVVFRQNKSGVNELFAHARRAENEKPFRRGIFFPEKFDRALRRGVELRFIGVDSHFAQMLQIILDALGRIICKKGVTDPQFIQQR